MDFEADPISKIKPLILKTIFPISNSIKFTSITQLKYCQKLDFKADPTNKFKILIIKIIFSDLNRN
jgi:hypothetical protein